MMLLAVLSGPIVAGILLIVLNRIRKHNTQRREKWILLKKQQDETESLDK